MKNQEKTAIEKIVNDSTSFPKIVVLLRRGSRALILSHFATELQIPDPKNERTQHLEPKQNINGK